MSLPLRVFRIASAVVVLVFMFRKISRSKFDVSDTLFWLFFSAGLVVVAVFPSIAFFFSSLLGFQSASNFVFLVVIALLLYREFTMQGELVALRRKVTSLAQEAALAGKRDSD